jgi:hypothetical protein
MTTSQLLADLRYHWGDVYDFARARPEGFTATARFGEHEVLRAGDLHELQAKVRRHYPGSAVERMST